MTEPTQDDFNRFILARLNAIAEVLVSKGLADYAGLMAAEARLLAQIDQGIAERMAEVRKEDHGP